MGPSPARRALDFLLTASTYAVAAFGSQAFTMPGTNISLVWLPAGVAVATMWLRGTWLWTAVALTEAAVAAVEGNGAFNVARVVAANTAAPLVIVLVLRRVRFDAALARFRDAVALLLSAAAGSAAGGVVNASLRLGERGVTGDAPQRLLNWWLGDVTGILVIAPVAFTWAARGAQPGGFRKGELAILTALLAAIPVLALVAFPHGPAVLVSALYPAVPMQVWVSARLGPRGATQAFAVIAGGVLLASVLTLGAPGVDPGTSLILVDGFLMVSAATGLVVAALVADNARAAGALAEARRLETVRRLAAGLAHDFHNLLTVILGHVDLLRTGPVRAGDASDLDAIRGAADRAASITQQLLTYSQEMLVRPTRFDVNALAEEVAEALRAGAGPVVAVRTSLGEGLPAVRSDRDQLRRVLGHLCRRAVAAMPEGGTIALTTRAGSLRRGAAAIPGVALTVQDSGAALETGGAASLLEPYAGPLGTGDPERRASGLELAMADGFIRQVQGAIEVRSAPGAGTSVTLTLPAEGPAG